MRTKIHYIVIFHYVYASVNVVRLKALCFLPVRDSVHESVRVVDTVS